MTSAGRSAAMIPKLVVMLLWAWAGSGCGTTMTGVDAPSASQSSPPAAVAGAPSPGASAPRGVCSSDGWCWHHSFRSDIVLSGIWGSGPKNVFAVGEGGAVLQLGGTPGSGAATGSTVAARPSSDEDKYRVTPTLDPSSKYGIVVPVDLPHALRELDKMLSADLRHEIKEPSEDPTLKYHHGLGRWIRNHWLAGNSPLRRHLQSLGFTITDEMSGFILTSYWRHLNGESPDPPPKDRK